jgi:hypothetical protein
MQIKNKGKTCDGPECLREAYCKGFCIAHYHQFRNSGILKPVRKLGDGRIQDGYHHTYRPDHPNARKDGYVATNRLVMSEHLGRPLLPNETVHHRNTDKLDNSIENLELWVGHHGTGGRVDDLVQFSLDVLRQYAPDKLSL